MSQDQPATRARSVPPVSASVERVRLRSGRRLHDLRACRTEMELLHAIAHCWNTQPGPWPFFPDFLELVYTALAAA